MVTGDSGVPLLSTTANLTLRKQAVASPPRMSEAGRFVSWLEAHAVRPIVVVSHPRSGTHLMMDALRLNFRECRAWKRPGEPLERLYLNLDSLTCAESLLSW